MLLKRSLDVRIGDLGKMLSTLIVPEHLISTQLDQFFILSSMNRS